MASKFLPDENNKRLLPGFIAFCMAAVGVALGFLASQVNSKPLSIFSVCVVFVGVAGGFAFVMRGIFNILFLGGFKKGHADYKKKFERPRLPWE